MSCSSIPHPVGFGRVSRNRSPGLKSDINGSRTDSSKGANRALVFVRSSPCLLTKIRICRVSAWGNTGVTMMVLDSFTWFPWFTCPSRICPASGKVGSFSCSNGGGSPAPDSSRWARKELEIHEHQGILPLPSLKIILHLRVQKLLDKTNRWTNVDTPLVYIVWKLLYITLYYHTLSYHIISIIPSYTASNHITS